LGDRRWEDPVVSIEAVAEANPLLFAVESRREFFGKKLPMDGCGRLQRRM
jgi:hypothetical protein